MIQLCDCVFNWYFGNCLYANLDGGWFWARMHV